MLDDDTIARYARQIVIPGFGASGQEQMLASTVLVAGNRRGCSQAALYLRAAGARVVEGFAAAVGYTIDVIVLAGVDTCTDVDREAAQALGKPVCWYFVDERGFVSGVHPDAPLPAVATLPAASSVPFQIHDAAACDAASVACAIVTGLPWRSAPVRFDC